MNKVSSWKELTLREKIGQTVVCLCETDKHIEMCGSIEKFLEKYPVGGIFNNGALVKGLLVGANPNFKDIVKEYNKYLRVPLISTADHGSYASDCGIELPPQMALGATANSEFGAMAGEFKAEDYKNSGIHWGFWPVCDINTSDRSPIVDIRAVSDNWELVAEITEQEIEKMKEKGVIPTLKHYPGPPYGETIDAHLAPFDNKTPIGLWRETYGKLYKKLIDAGVPTIMTGHINLVDYQTEMIDGEYPPATMSYELTTKLLREELGFKGVVVTDALVMGGFLGTKAIENTIQSFLSGNDVLLWPSYEYIDEMEKRILSGEIDEKILDASVERIWNLKKEYGIIDDINPDMETEPEYFSKRADKIAEKCITLVKDKNKILPVSADKIKKVCVVCVTPDDEQYQDLCGLKEEFEHFGCNVRIQRDAWKDEMEKVEDEYDLIVYALCRTPHRPVGPLDFWGEQATSIWTSNCSDKSKTIVASFGTPYLYRYYEKSGITYINGYSCARPVLRNFVKAVFGEIEFEGKSPVLFDGKL